jgi:calcium/calmodulin-dependent protein kinase (CaM kinase) II
MQLSYQLLNSIANRDWDSYLKLCDPSLTAFEPEARGHLVEGMDFHRFYFEHGQEATPGNTTISTPHVRVLGDTAVVCYVRLSQRLDADGSPETVRFEETRVWQRQNGLWKHVHFHRSRNP